MLDLGCGEGGIPGIWRQGEGDERHVMVMNYFEPKTWEAPLNKGTIPVVWRHRTIEDYVKTFIKSGFTIKDINEPRATEEQVEAHNALRNLRKIPLYIFWELQK